ncbi:hypothetical protein BDZ91DRAFT_763847 [Kalaharituber pfeilii]|nr:hypothetical protein BDZ91DRAFT_763847 [Kalaharituber pfeilii]
MYYLDDIHNEERIKIQEDAGDGTRSYLEMKDLILREVGWSTIGGMFGVRIALQANCNITLSIEVISDKLDFRTNVRGQLSSWVTFIMKEGAGTKHTDCHEDSSYKSDGEIEFMGTEHMPQYGLLIILEATAIGGESRAVDSENLFFLFLTWL